MATSQQGRPAVATLINRLTVLLLDSNIIIYSYSDEFSYLRKFFVADDVFVSEISRVEVLGYHKLKEKEEAYFKDVFELLPARQKNIRQSISAAEETSYEIRRLLDSCNSRIE